MQAILGLTELVFNQESISRFLVGMVKLITSQSNINRDGGGKSDSKGDRQKFHLLLILSLVARFPCLLDYQTGGFRSAGVPGDQPQH